MKTAGTPCESIKQFGNNRPSDCVRRTLTNGSLGKSENTRARGFFPPLVVLTLLLAAPGALVRTDSVESVDGVRLDLSPQGKITGIRIGETVLPLVAAGGFSIADFGAQPAPVNLVPNPGFEEGAKGWRLSKGQSLDAGILHSGRNSIKMEVPGPQPATSDLEVVVPAKPNTRYRVGMWVRREKVRVCGAYSSERDDANKPTGKQSQTGPGIPAQDGVWLPLSWEIATEPKTTRLSLRANIYRSTGTLWLDDFFVEEISEGVFESVEGRVDFSGKEAVLRASMPRQGLALEATFGADPQCLRINGVVRDTTGRDRAVGVKFALPLDLAGWTWHHDTEERETIETGKTYRLTYDCVSGIGRCSIYPWSAITGHGAGLSVALPLGQGPRVFVLQHDQRVPETSLIFYFGLSKDAGNHPSRAPFSLVIYRHDPSWGMRSAAEKYYRLFPESFVKRPAFEAYLNYANMERFDPVTHQLVVNSKDRLDDVSDFGEGFKFVWHLHGCYDFRQVAGDSPKRPSDETVLAWLRRMVEAERTRPRDYTPATETMKKMVLGSRGEISYIGDTRYWPPHTGYNHTDKPGWGLNFRVNEDPGVSSFLADVSKRKAEQYAKTPDRRPWDAAFTADAIEGYFANSHGMDFRREHFRTTLVPLSFGYGNLEPAIPNTIWDFHHKAWWPITEQYKIVTYGNANGYEQFFTMPYVDVPMTEGSWDADHPGRLDRFMRAVSYQKIWRYWHAWDKKGGYGDKDPANVRAQFRRGLAYAIYPPVACVGGSALEPHRALYRQYVPAIEELSRAGWEPVPYTAASEGVIVERFGAYDQGELHFTLRNYADKPVETILVPDWRSLRAPAGAEWVFMDILSGTPRLLPFPEKGLALDLEPDGTRALWVGTREQAAQHAFRLAQATLEKLERSFSAEMSEADKANWAKALQTAQAGAQATGERAVALAETVQQLTTELQTGLATKSPVDLAKTLFRLRTQVSLAPVALLALQSDAPRLRTLSRGGGEATVTWRLRVSQIEVTNLQARVVSPWPEIAQKCRVALPIQQLSKEQELDIEVGLSLPAAPPRKLLPFLLEVRGKAGSVRFTVAIPVDVQIVGD